MCDTQQPMNGADSAPQQREAISVRAAYAFGDWCPPRRVPEWVKRAQAARLPIKVYR